MKKLNPHSTSTCKYKSSKLPLICKTHLSKTLKKFLSSHLTPLKRKSSSSLKISKRTEKHTVIKKEIKISISILEWSPKEWPKFNKSEWAFNNKSWWKSVSLNTTLPNIKINSVLSCKSKWCPKESDQQLNNWLWLK